MKQRNVISEDSLSHWEHFRIDSVVDWLRAERSGVHIPAVATDFSLFQNAESGTEDHPDSCSVSIGVSFLGVKRPGREAVWKTLPGQRFPPGTSTFVFQLSFHQLPVSVYLPPSISPLGCSCWDGVSQHHRNQTERFLFVCGKLSYQLP